MIADARCTLVCAAVLLFGQPCLGAMIDVDFNGDNCPIRISGPIVAGDLKTLQSKVAGHENMREQAPLICLNSKEGGDFMEGLAIANFVADAEFPTLIDANASCVSACSWIFMAGNTRASRGTRLARSIDAHGRLAFHAPSIPPSNVYIPPNVSPVLATIEAYNQAVAEIGGRILSFAQRYTTDDVRAFVAPSLVAAALIKTGQNTLAIDTVDKAIRWDINVATPQPVLPRSRKDLTVACMYALAYANDFWEPKYFEVKDVDEYLAFYDEQRHLLTAQLVVDSANACELQITFDDDLTAVLSTEVVANLGSQENLGLAWIADRYWARKVFLPDYAFLSWGTRLDTLPQKPSKPLDPHTLVTLSTPTWCSAQTQKKPDEAAVCGSARLSAYDILLVRYYADSLAKAATTDRAGIQSDQQTWLVKRSACKADEDCLHGVYLSRIRALRGSP